MANVVRIFTAALFVAASAGYTQTAHGDYAVSLELAKKAAVYNCVTCHGEFLLEEWFEDFLISEPEAFYSLQ